MKVAYLLLIVACVFLSSCDKALLGNDEKLVTLEENLAVPPGLNDGWETSTMESQNIRPDRIKDLVASLQTETHNIHSILIIKNNKLVLESYFGGWHRNRLQGLLSASKSVTSALVGIAIDKNKIAGVQQKVFDFFPEYADLKTAEKDKIVVQDLLTMSAGLDWHQSPNAANDPSDDENRMSNSKDEFRYVLEKPVVYPAGKFFNYNSGCSDLLVGILHHALKEDADTFAEENLFKPLGIKNHGWQKLLNGHPNAAYGLHLYPRDMAKFGQLFLDSGAWHGQRVISKQWIAESTATKIGTGVTGTGYAYQWWTSTWNINGSLMNTYQAQGNGGQIICVVPQKNAVVVMTGHNWANLGSLPYNLLEGVILPAL
jgi:CubicO group peptidase (beta-lactamase class C family)